MAEDQIIGVESSISAKLAFDARDLKK